MWVRELRCYQLMWSRGAPCYRVHGPLLSGRYIYQRLHRLLAHTVPVRSHYCVYLDLKAQSRVAIAPTAAAVQQHRQSFYLEAPAKASKQTLALGGVATLVQCPERRALCLQAPSVRRSGEVGVAVLGRGVQVVRGAWRL